MARQRLPILILHWLAKRYGITDKEPVFMKMTGTLNKFTNMAKKRGMLPAK